MNIAAEWNHKIFNNSSEDFRGLALDIFNYQYRGNLIYRQFADAIGRGPSTVREIADIPFLPVRFFKSHEIKTGKFEAQAIFESSGTTGMINSMHYIKETSIYEESFLRGFELAYGSPDQWCVLGLLPSYLERGNSSLVYMTDQLIKKSGHPHSGSYLNNLEELSQVLMQLKEQKQKVFLISVTFALIELANKFPLELDNIVIVETGGMKGRGKEMIREELHEVLKKAFNVSHIHSEYGMTELLSQAWSKGEGIFTCPPWMKIVCRDEEDPLTVRLRGKGALNIIDLANVHSCSFIATDDAGKVYDDGSFEVLGRMDGSDLRGCSMLY